MSQSRVGRSLFRACIRWAKHAEGVPFSIQHRDAFLPASAAAAADTFTGSADVQALARTAFREHMHAEVCPPHIPNPLTPLSSKLSLLCACGVSAAVPWLYIGGDIAF